MTTSDQIDALRSLYSPKTSRDVLAGMPELQAFRARLDDPNWPSPQEVADARAALAIDPACRQSRLVLEAVR